MSAIVRKRTNCCNAAIVRYVPFASFCTAGKQRAFFRLTTVKSDTDPDVTEQETVLQIFRRTGFIDKLDARLAVEADLPHPTISRGHTKGLSPKHF